MRTRRLALTFLSIGVTDALVGQFMCRPLVRVMSSSSCQAAVPILTKTDSMTQTPSTIADLRKEYSSEGLVDGNIPQDPFVLFGQWFEEARKANVLEPNAMVCIIVYTIILSVVLLTHLSKSTSFIVLINMPKQQAIFPLRTTQGS